PLPAHAPRRDRHHGAGGAGARSRRARGPRTVLRQGDRRPAHLRGARLERDQPGLGRERARHHQQLREPALERREACRPHRRARDRPAPLRPAVRARLDGRQDRARVRGRGQEGRGPDRPPDQPRRPQGLGQVPEGRGAQEGDRTLRGGLGGGGVGPDGLGGVPRGHPSHPGPARGGGAPRRVREPGADGNRDRVRARRPAPPPEAEQGPRRRALRLPGLSPDPRMHRVRYTAWDGTQQVRLSADDVFEKLSEYLSFTDDVQQALDWLLHQGLEWRQGMRVMGLDDFLEHLRDLEDFTRRYGDLFHGPRSLSYEEALALMRAMERLKRLEEQLVSGDLDAVDPESLRELLGLEAGQNFQLLKDVMLLLVNAGYLTQREGRARLSPKGVRKIGQLALRDIYQGLLRDRAGSHQTDHRGLVQLRPEETKPYHHGDPLEIDLVGTLKKTLTRRTGCGWPPTSSPATRATTSTSSSSPTASPRPTSCAGGSTVSGRSPSGASACGRRRRRSARSSASPAAASPSTPSCSTTARAC